MSIYFFCLGFHLFLMTLKKNISKGGGTLRNNPIVKVGLDVTYIVDLPYQGVVYLFIKLISSGLQQFP